jgi:Rrf2 family protein
MLSKKSQYALKALLLLAKEEGRGPVLISDLSQQGAIPKKFLEGILLDLKHHGLLQSLKGKGGGYRLGKPAGAITFGQVIRILDGPLAPVGCVSQSAYQRCAGCRDERTCGIRMVMQEVRDRMAGVLDGTSLTDGLRQVNDVKSSAAIRKRRPMGGSTRKGKSRKYGGPLTGRP